MSSKHDIALDPVSVLFGSMLRNELREPPESLPSEPVYPPEQALLIRAPHHTSNHSPQKSNNLIQTVCQLTGDDEARGLELGVAKREARAAGCGIARRRTTERREGPHGH
jgi:hypothetical protein